MAAPIEFWIALTSPASYLASLRIEDVARKHGRIVRWRPYNIREAFIEEGIKPNVAYERKGAYSRRDWARTARFYGHDFKMPEPFRRSSVPAMAIAYWAEPIYGPEAFKRFCARVMAAYFTENRSIDDPDVLIELALASGFDGDDARAAIDDPEANDAIEKVTKEALHKGIWGAPFMIVDGEPFWGEDRLDQVDLWLKKAGW